MRLIFILPLAVFLALAAAFGWQLVSGNDPSLLPSALERGHFTVTRDGDLVAELYPEKRFYPVQRMPTTEAAIHTTGLADLYAVIGDPQDPAQRNGAWTVRLYHEPLVPWMWAGALIMMLGGLVSLSDRRLRCAGSCGSPITA